MDGNARWAQRNRAEIRAGHERGVPALRETVRCCVAWGIEALTVYAFSSENWARGEPEVAFLMQLMARTLRADAPELAEQGVRVSVIGDREPLPGSLRREIDRAEELTRGCPRLHLSIAINYGGRQAIAAAASARGGDRPRDRRGAAAREPAPVGPRPADPHERRAAPQQLPAVGGGVLRAALHRDAVAGLRGGRPPCSDPRLRLAEPPLRRAGRIEWMPRRRRA
eukprot:CAMPEP_0177620570 /NCGR_PEP_ID=MMETSP0419_2-20121207/27001_1 /TAXON_ID=582737 /ORGANISM="Tetraselmis sp., Strain GSL018" /LENGTH=224 /DNA_ID=CAMNT_0019120187 /DNA_START=737 /DNA_END=1411 /DNA_ORIENTATION=+